MPEGQAPKQRFSSGRRTVFDLDLIEAKIQKRKVIIHFPFEMEFSRQETFVEAEIEHVDTFAILVKITSDDPINFPDKNKRIWISKAFIVAVEL